MIGERLIPVVAYLIMFTLFYRVITFEVPSWFSSLHLVLSVFGFMEIFLNYSYCVFRDPGQYRFEGKIDYSHCAFISETSMTDSYGFNLKCKDCKHERLPRVHHCSTCKKCIVLLDHHCPWIAQCVGYGNIKQFFSFLVWTSIGILYYLIVDFQDYNQPVKIFIKNLIENYKSIFFKVINLDFSFSISHLKESYFDMIPQILPFCVACPIFGLCLVLSVVMTKDMA